MEGYGDLLSGIKRSMISDRLLSLTISFYNNTIECLSKNKDSKIARHLNRIAKGFREITETSLKKEEVVTKRDCPLCKGDGTIQCYWCSFDKPAICPNCKGKTCSACDKTGICPVCLGIGEGEISCPIDTVISRGPEDSGTTRMAANETFAMASLNVLKSVQAVWMQGDTDRNGKKDFWTYDVSCFHRMFRADGSTKVAAIDITFAQADAAPAKDDIFGKGVIEPWKDKVPAPVPNKGYLFRAMTNSDKNTPYNINSVGPNNIPATNNFLWGFCAYLAEYNSTGIRTFIINQAGTIYAIDNRGEAVLQ